MLSLKRNDKSFEFATVNNKTIFINDDNDDDIIDNNFGKFLDIGKKHTFELVPNNESTRLCIFGPSGVGKSTITAKFLEQYKKKYKKNKIFIVSPTQDDAAYDKLKQHIEYIKIDDSLITDPMDFKEFEHCCILFDDAEMLSSNKELNHAIELFRNQCLENGRKRNISTIVINHTCQNGMQTKKVLNECDLIIVFPKSNFSAVSKLCKTYYGFQKDQIEYLQKVKSRFVVIKRSYPMAILSEHELKLL